MKRHASTIILVAVFLVGLSLLLYPSFSDWWNSLHQTRVVASYMGAVTDLNNDEYNQIWEDAREYNADLAAKPINYVLSDEESALYNQLLNVSGDGVMGYVEIPRIHVKLPVFHGTDEETLQVAIGHIAGSSLPTGGPGTHCVISGHTGLPRARLFTDINQLSVGDTFTLNVLDEVLTYEVDQIRIVLPYELDNLSIEEGKDYCTLVTCTPYGINTHRLLVRGHRVETKSSNTVRVTADALQIEPTLVAVIIAVPMLLILIFVVLITSGIRRKHNHRRGTGTDEE